MVPRCSDWFASFLSRTLCLAILLVLARPTGAQAPAGSRHAAAQALFKAGEEREAASDLTGAATLYRQAATAWRRAGHWQGWAESTLALGYMLIDLARYPEAAASTRQLLDEAERRLGSHHLLTARSRKMLGMVALQTGHYAQARAEYQRALESGLGPPLLDSGFVGAVLRDLGTVCTKYEDAPGAIRYYERALRWLPARDQRRNVVLADMGAAYQKIGAYPAALDALWAGLRADVAVYSDTVPQLAFTYNDLGICYQGLGDTRQATACFSRAMALMARAGSEANPVTIGALNSLTRIRLAAGDYAGARQLMSRCAALARRAYPPDHPDFAHFAINTGDALLAQHLPDSARVAYAAGMAHARRTIGPVSDLEAFALLGMGRAAAACGDTVQARRLLSEGARAARAVGAPTRIAEAERALARLAPSRPIALQHLGAALEALVPGFRAHQTPLPTLDQLHADPLLVEVLADRARLLEGQRHAPASAEDLRAALATYRLIAHLTNQLRDVVATDDGHLATSERAAPLLARAVGVCARLADLAPTQAGRAGLIAEAFSFAEQERARLLRAALARQTALRYADVPAAVVRRDQTYHAALTWTERQATSAGTAERPTWEARALRLRHTYAGWLDTLRQTYPRYFALRHQPAGAPLRQVQATLGPDETLVQYVVAPPFQYAFVVGANSARLLTLPARVEELARQASRLTTALRPPGHDRKAFQEAAYTLYAAEVAPLKLAPTRHLIVIPDGPLHYIPFEVLLTRAPSAGESARVLPYLLREYTIRYATSATVLTQIHQLSAAPEAGAQSRFAAFAPTATLPAATREAQQVAATLGGIAVLGPAATEQRFKGAAPGLLGIHLATHATVNDQQPLDSHLDFYRSGRSDTANDGRLHTWELYGLRLPARLITLSACNTGHGQLAQGEGVLSLARGFLYAGCPSVVMSLWPTPDQTTQRLMTTFYEELADGRSKADALRKAKLAYLDQADDLMAAPAYWAGLVLVGDAQPLVPPRARAVWPLWAGLAAATAVLAGGAAWLGRRRLYSSSSSRRARSV